MKCVYRIATLAVELLAALAACIGCSSKTPPEPKPPRVIRSRTQTWQVRKTAWMPWSRDGDKLRDQVMKEAQKLVAQAARSEEYISQSKAGAEAVIAAFYAEVGWRVEVRWADAGGGSGDAEAR